MMLIIISGCSGSGKSVALHTLEDIGFYCVDNLPVNLLPELTFLLAKKKFSTAVSIDIRNIPNNFKIFEKTINKLPSIFFHQLLFLDANYNTIIKRYSDTRRIHPLFNKNLLLEKAIKKENKILEQIRSCTDLIIDTSEMSVHELLETIKNRLVGKHKRKLTIIFKSFGFKYGLPIDADYVFDVRFLPNPYWNLKLRSITGLDNPVKNFLDKNTEIYNFIYQTKNYIKLWLPMLETNNRSYLTIAIGCTGGKHCSVYIVEQLVKYFRSNGKNVQSYHRTLEKIKNIKILVLILTIYYF
ncbi:RNase adapter protein RapZ [Candidatus Providencia siddallii]|uniref:RNase adapter protein RapZ n=1 Tax=Candidatus Providencia siddallii TaxID=1715285 RepID=A0ABM9NPE2_9GAMM